jgi:hypothetical protein
MIFVKKNKTNGKYNLKINGYKQFKNNYYTSIFRGPNLKVQAN